MLTVIDEHSRECLAIHVQRQLKSDDVLAVLTDLFVKPKLDTILYKSDYFQSSERTRASVTTTFSGSWGELVDAQVCGGNSLMLAGSAIPAALKTLPTWPETWVRVVMTLPSFSMVAS